MKLKTITASVLLATTVLAVSSLAQQTRATPETSPAKAAQVNKIEAQLSRSMKLPGKLLEAQFVQEQLGNGILGPSDFKAFYALKVPASDIPAWEAALAATPVVNGSGTYAKPKQTQSWWVSEADFKTLKLHGPKNLTGWVNGWVGLSPDGRIFIHSFTM